LDVPAATSKTAAVAARTALSRPRQNRTQANKTRDEVNARGPSTTAD